MYQIFTTHMTYSWIKYGCRYDTQGILGNIPITMIPYSYMSYLCLFENVREICQLSDGYRTLGQPLAQVSSTLEIASTIGSPPFNYCHLNPQPSTRSSLDSKFCQWFPYPSAQSKPFLPSHWHHCIDANPFMVRSHKFYEVLPVFPCTTFFKSLTVLE